MPALDILGYLWEKRQDVGIETPAEALRLAADLLDAGLSCIQIEDQITLGTITGATTTYPHKTREEWQALVHQTFVDDAVAHTHYMMSAEVGDGE